MAYLGPAPANSIIATSDIEDDAVTAAKIAANAVDSSEIAAGAVDLAHMSSESVDEDNLHISNSGSNGQFLSKQSGNSGGLTWAAAGGFVSGDVILADDGAVDAPGLAFADDTDNGLYRIGTNNIALATAGTKRIDINASGAVGIGAAPVAGYVGLSVTVDHASSSANYFTMNGNGAHNIVAANTHSDGAGGAAIYGTVAGDAANSLQGFATHATYGSSWQAVLCLHASRAASSNYHFLQAIQNGDREFDLQGDGNGYCDGSWSGSGADYAEYFEWQDGNPDSEDRVGISVVLEGDLIRAATGDDAAATIIGVVSGNPVVVGDTAWSKWRGKHLRDDFGRYLQEEHPTYSWTDDDGEFHSHAQDDLPEGLTPPADVEAVMIERRIVNPDWIAPTEFHENGDPVETYVSRKDRPEWDTVGLMGKLRMKKGQPTGDRWIKMRDVSDDVEEWLVR